jgi:uncharacterized protein YjiS (DUF1127 family)
MSLSNNTWRLPSSQQQILPASSNWLSRLQAGLFRIRTAWMSRRQRERDARLLRSLSDRELWDLGLGRSDISRVAKGTYRRD